MQLFFFQVCSLLLLPTCFLDVADVITVRTNSIISHQSLSFGRDACSKPASVQAGQVVEMATIAYRYTFLDVLLEEEDRARELRGPDAARARSAPASRGCRKAANRDLEELEKHRYVLSLPKPEPKTVESMGRGIQRWQRRAPQPLPAPMRSHCRWEAL